MSLIQISNLCKSYKNQNGDKNEVFKNFDLEIPDGHKFISLTGPDGSGKSTLLKLISGVIKPSSGKIVLGGFIPDSSNTEFTKQISYMSQTLGLYNELSVDLNLRLFAGLKGVNLQDKQDYLDDLLNKVGLLKFKEYAVNSLSGGMKQKLGVTCAIASKPQFLILDEPTVGVDPLSRNELWDIIDQYLSQSNAVCIYSTAYLEEAQTADLTIILENGKLVVCDEAKNITQKIANQTFSIEPNLQIYQKTARNLMFKTALYDENSPILDICPRTGKLNLLVKKGENFNSINKFVKENFGDSLNLQKREPILEDAYIALTQDFSKTKKTQLEKREFDKNRVVVEAIGIKKKFGDFTAVESSSFTVKKGEIFGLLGPNGAGKTTTFRMICALLNMSEGEVLIENYNLKRAKSSVRAKIGYVSQKFSLYKKLSVYQNLEYFGRSYAIEKSVLKERIDELLQDFGLEKFRNELGESLPFGASRNLSMACALIHRPEILFLDESTSGADPSARRFFWNRINSLVESGLSVIVTTHFMEEAEYCDRFLIQDRGKILVLGSPNEICVKDGKRVSIHDAFIDEVVKFRQKENL